MQNNIVFSLNGAWTLAYADNKTFTAQKPDFSTIAGVRAAGWKEVPATVPGNFEIDLQRAGVIEDPFMGTNTIDCRRFFEYLHLVYYRTFTLDRDPDADTILRFEGIDTVATVYVNGVPVGCPDNMLIPWEFHGDDLRKGENEIVVHIVPAVIAQRDYEVPYETTELGGRQLVSIRKAPHMHGWDIMPRLISGGIWRPCAVVFRAADRIDDVFAHAKNVNAAESKATLVFTCHVTTADDEIENYRVRVEGRCGDSTFSATSGALARRDVSVSAWVGNAKLWWPHNYGEPNVYDCTATLLYKDEPVFTRPLTAGIRTVELERTSTTDEEGHGEFCFRVNGKKVFWMGSNWVPVDALHSRDRDRLPAILPMLSDLGCNCLRCWGGNVYEDDFFYDWCDRHGIMIWQDFTMACCYNPQDEDFRTRLAYEVMTVVKRLRSHPSIVLWAGDNEVDSCFRGAHDPNNNVLTRRVIPDVLHVWDETRPYLPSSPYIDEEAYRTGKPTSENHLWGPRDYFKSDFYAKSVCHFASETGYHGCPSPDSLKRYIHPDQLWPWRSAPDSDLPKPDWGCHSSAVATDGSDYCVWRIRMMSNQVKVLFDAVPEELDDFARASQISQAEAKKFFIERFRVTKWRRTGIIWWNLIDGWPEISDAVVDYYGCKKLAYHYIKRSQQPLCLIFDEPAGGVLPLHAVSDLQQDVTIRYTLRDLTTGETLREAEAAVTANQSVPLFDKPFTEGEQHFYLMTWEYDLGGRTVRGVNHYMTGLRNVNLAQYLGYMEKAGFGGEFSGFTGL